MGNYAFYQIEFGYLKIGYDDGAVISLKCSGAVDDEDVHSPLSDLAYTQIREYLDGKRQQFDFPYVLHGTEFQKKSWRALCEIPYGQTRTYREIATAIGNPNACRAVGMANHDNPLWIVVPCHRVIGANGKLTGYAGGLKMKEALLELERTQAALPGGG